MSKTALLQLLVVFLVYKCEAFVNPGGLALRIQNSRAIRTYSKNCGGVLGMSLSGKEQSSENKAVDKWSEDVMKKSEDVVQTMSDFANSAIPHPEEAKLLLACAICNRGQGATYAEKKKVESLAAKLEGVRPFDIKLLNGEWRLLYASEAVTRSSPFFWAFRKATKDFSQPLPMLPSALSEALFAITDGIPFASIGKSTQTISGMGAEGVDGELVSSVEVSLRLFDALLPPNVGYVTTTSRLTSAGEGKLKLTVETTEVKDSSWNNIPVVGKAFENVKFPSGEVLEQVKSGSSAVELQTIYLSKELRVSRSSDGQLFVHARLHHTSDTVSE